MLVNNRSILFTNRPRTPSSSHLHIARLAFYPASVLIGEAIISSVGQSMILAAAPPLIHLIVLATMSALLLMPIFAAIKFLIDNGFHFENQNYNKEVIITKQLIKPSIRNVFEIEDITRQIVEFIY